jgi:hypothetical protein
LSDNLGDRLFRAVRAIDPTAPYGSWQMLVSGTVNTIGGGLGGTSMVDNNPFTPGGTSITPAGGYFGGRQVASGNAAAPAISGSAILQVHVVAGGAGGGVANITVHGTAGNDVNVGVASGAAGAAGNWAMPVVYASGMYATVNAVIGAANIVGLAGSVQVVGSVRTTGLGGSIGALGIGGSVGVVGAGGSMGVVGLGGSVGVTQITTPWVVVGSQHIGGGQVAMQVESTGGAALGVGQASNNLGAWPNHDGGAWLPVMFPSGFYPTVNISGGAGGGFASVAVYGSPANPVYNIGSVNVVNAVGVFGSVGVVGSVHVSNFSAGAGFASVAVYGSPANPVYNVGTVHVSNFAAGTGFATAAVYGSPAFPVYAVGSVHIVNAGDISAGSGFATVAVYGSPAFPVYNVGTVHVSNFSAGTGFASVAVYGSPAMPVYVIGSVNSVGGGGSMGVTQIGAPWSFVGSAGVTNLGGSTGVVQITSPWIVTGSVGVTPLATFTVALDKIPTVSIGLGTVNIGNVITNVGSVFTTPLGVQIVDTRGSLVPTQWPFSFGGSGYFAIANAPGANLSVKVHAVHLSVAATVRTFVSFQSPSGTFLTGSIPVPPGGGFNLATGIANAIWVGGSNGTLFIQASGTENMAGWLSGVVSAA